MNKSEKRKIGFLKICMGVLFAGILAKLFCVQILDHDEYVAKAREQHVSENVIPASRGEIYMMDGQEAVKVVMNETVFTVIFDPLIVDEEKVKEILEKYAKDNLVAKWEDVFSDKTRRYYVVARNVNYQNAKKIEEEELVGVYFEKTIKRVYPEGEMASGLLGFVNADGVGQYGVEGAFNGKLAGTDGSLKSVRDVNGIALSIGDENIEKPAVDGEDVYLSVDRNIQTKIEKILMEKVDNSDATNASAIVLDPNTGKVLAMANVPNYDPANYGNVKDAGAYINYVLEEAYEPASVCKTLTFAAGVDMGLINRDTTYYNTLEMTVDGLTFHNVHEGFQGQTITLQRALNYSLNTGSATVLKMIGGGEFNEEGRTKLYEYLRKFGLGQYTGIELYEVPGLVPTPNEYQYTMDYTYATMTFGQGMNMTLLQLAAAYAAVINGGIYRTPTILETRENEAREERVISEEASAEMREFLRGVRIVLRNNGIDKAGYFIGGKTGTGQVVLEDGSYSVATEETIATYAGFGGAEGELPRYLVLVKVWGDGHYFGGEDDAQPLFNQISDYLLTYLKIQPNL